MAEVDSDTPETPQKPASKSHFIQLLIDSLSTLTDLYNRWGADFLDDEEYEDLDEAINELEEHLGNLQLESEEEEEDSEG